MKRLGSCPWRPGPDNARQGGFDTEKPRPFHFAMPGGANCGPRPRCRHIPMGPRMPVKLRSRPCVHLEPDGASRVCGRTDADMVG